MTQKDKQETLIVLAQKIDSELKSAFLEIEPNFYHFYIKELNRLRKKDALHQQINVLKEYQSTLRGYNKKLEKYNNLMKHKNNIKELYHSWKKKELKSIADKSSDKKQRTRGESGHNIDIEHFFIQEKADILKILQTKDEKYITLNELKKVLRNETKSKNPARFVLQQPQKPTFTPTHKFKKNEITLEYSKKTDYELLMDLGMLSLDNLDHAIQHAISSKNTSPLYPLILFTFCHSTGSTTKGKEYKRTDKQENQDPSKTSGPSFENLYTEYLNLIEELKIDID